MVHTYSKEAGRWNGIVLQQLYATVNADVGTVFGSSEFLDSYINGNYYEKVISTGTWGM